MTTTRIAQWILLPTLALAAVLLGGHSMQKTLRHASGDHATCHRLGDAHLGGELRLDLLHVGRVCILVPLVGHPPTTISRSRRDPASKLVEGARAKSA